jgi:ATP-dependent DNA helicase RecQ
MVETVESASILSTLRQYFGFTEFRPLQEEIIHGILAGRDTFVLMPTGGGKSLCYQLPALMLPGLTVVVSPLIALMKDQVDALVENGIAATFINSSLQSWEIEERRQQVRRGEIKLLYLAPERLNGEFLRFLESLNLSLFAIDEAHCISEWGHDFRIDYRQLSKLRDRFPSTPIIAMTATANERVQEDIVDQLKLHHDLLRYRASFDRSNLYYEVRQKERGLDQVLDVIKAHRGESGIIYCQSRQRTEDMADFLRSSGFRALPYHAGLDNETRAANQEKFVRDDVEIICATIAFGMGIDKPDIRFVVHYDLPKNLMSYYQETGRGGRDSLPSDCILFFSPGDRVKIMRFIEEKPDPHERILAMQQLDEMVAFAETADCRRRTILSYFGEVYPKDNCGNCDTCTKPDMLEDWDATRPAQMFLSCVVRVKEEFGTGHVIDVLRGSKGARILNFRHNLLPTYGIGMDLSKHEWRSLAHLLLRDGLLHQDANHFNALRLTQRGADFLRNREPLILRRQKKVEPAPRRARGLTTDLPEANAALFEHLRTVRKQLADAQDVPAYVIFDNKTLIQMAAQLPRTMQEFRDISGIGQTKAQHYGGTFLNEISRFVAMHPELGAAEVTVTRSYDPPKRPATAGGTLELFRQGLSPEAIASSRRLSRATITDHLETLVASGEITEIDRLVPPEKLTTIEAAFRKCGMEKLKPVLEELGPDEGVSYNELKIVRAWMHASGEGGNGEG